VNLAIAIVAIAFGIGYGALSVAQFYGRTWFVLRPPASPPPLTTLRQGALVGMVVAALAVLGGVGRLIPDGAGAFMGFVLWTLFLAIALGGAVWMQRKTGAERRP
jgi:hypothetical protein